MRGGQPADPSNHYPAPGYLSGHAEAKGDSPRLAGIRKMLKRFVASKVIHGHTHEHDHHHPHQHSQDHRTRAGGNLNLTWRSLAALGVVGGLVPSVSALVILIAAIWLHRVGFELLLILAFSGGMA
jgi:ABC-type nickel/cobalt efflux system permease component RcnA